MPFPSFHLLIHPNSWMKFLLYPTASSLALKSLDHSYLLTQSHTYLYASLLLKPKLKTIIWGWRHGFVDQMPPAHLEQSSETKRWLHEPNAYCITMGIRVLTPSTLSKAKHGDMTLPAQCWGQRWVDPGDLLFIQSNGNDKFQAQCENLSQKLR